MRDAKLTLKVADGAEAAAEYQCNVKSAALTSEPGSVTSYRTLCPDGGFSSVAPSTWTLELAGPQDWSAEGLSRFLFEHEGDKLTFHLDAYGSDHVPTEDEPAMTGTCKAVSGAYGGEVDTYAEWEASMPVDGTPTLVTAATP
jgi:hypothetical protein